MAALVTYKLLLRKSLIPRTLFCEYPYSATLSKIKYSTQNDSRTKSKATIKLSNGKEISISSGKYARLTDCSVVATSGDTSVLVTAVSPKQPSLNSSFLPLTVNYRLKAAAAGRIPMNFFRRERGANEIEILSSRIIDRSIRPLFPEGFNSETQITCNMLALDGVNDSDVVAINATSAALALSDIPWNGPIGAVRVGLIDSKVIINPTRKELQLSSLNLVISAAMENLVIMLEGSANNVNEKDFIKAILAGTKECQTIARGISDLRKQFGKEKREVKIEVLDNDLCDMITSISKTKMTDILLNYNYSKLERDNAVNKLRVEVIEKLKSENPDVDENMATKIYGKLFKQVFRDLIFKHNKRCDGRGLKDLRDISCEVSMFPPLHGSALFQRGQTQVLCTVALDSLESSLKMDTLSMLTSGVKEKNFFLHYEFPPYATNETGKVGIADRREIGHGALAEKGIRAVLPKDYPFTIRLTSEVLESNGSSSMASVCGGSLALMDAGVPITEPVAGVALGLVTKYNEENNEIVDHRVLTDILGIEDYLGDMDFKLAGTKTGVTSFQADIKIPGLPLKYVIKIIERAKIRHKIIDIMNEAISAPRQEPKENMPVTEKMDIPFHQRGKFAGIGGCNIKKILVETGVQIHSEDNETYTLFAPNETAMNEAKEMIKNFMSQDREPELEFRGVYTAKIVEIRDVGVMVQLYPTMKPTLLHNTQLDLRKIQHPSALGLEVGQEIEVQYFGRDQSSGEIRLSRKVLQSSSNMKTILKNFFPPDS